MSSNDMRRIINLVESARTEGTLGPTIFTGDADREFIASVGALRIWDCGKIRYKWTK